MVSRVFKNALFLVFFAGVLHPVAGADIDQSRRTAIVSAVERAQPAVASIHVVYRQQVWQRQRSHDPFWDMFFPRYIPTEREHVGSRGSGFVASADGYMLTNDHVIGRNPHRILVSLPDGRDFEARYIASDHAFDLAVLKIDGEDLPVASLGDSDDILVGEWSIAIGNPFDLGPTVSVGVISALDRDFDNSATQGSYYYDDMIQTDAAINPGNSGGPLVNALGEVIGINSFIYTGNDYSIGSIGIGFAIPVGTARAFLAEVKRYGKVRTPWFGFRLQDLTREAARYFGLPSPTGAVVVHVDRASPAGIAGLERWDVIRSVNGTPINNGQDVKNRLEKLRVGDEFTLQLIRAGETFDMNLRLSEKPATRSGRY
jgi:serine protease Do